MNRLTTLALTMLTLVGCVTINPPQSEAAIQFCGANGDCVSTAFTNLSSTKMSPQAAGKRIRVTSPITVASNTTMPANMSLEVTETGLITVASGKYLALYGEIVNPGNRQIFSSSSNVYLAGSAGIPANPRNWGAIGDGITDDTNALFNSFNACRGALYGHDGTTPAGYGVSDSRDGCAKVFIPRGAYSRASNVPLPLWAGVELEFEVSTPGGLNVASIIDNYTVAGLYPTDLVIAVQANKNAAGAVVNNGSGSSNNIHHGTLRQNALTYGSAGSLLHYLTAAEASTYTGTTITKGHNDTIVDDVWFQAWGGSAININGVTNSIHVRNSFFDVGQRGIEAGSGFLGGVVDIVNTTFYACRQGAIVSSGTHPISVSIGSNSLIALCGTVYGETDKYSHSIFLTNTGTPGGSLSIHDSQFTGGYGHWEASSKMSIGSSIRTYGIDNINISGNLLDDIGIVETAPAGSGEGRQMCFYRASKIALTGNTFVSNDLTKHWYPGGTGDSALATDGVYTNSRLLTLQPIDVTAFNYTVTGNIMVNNSGTPFETGIYSDYDIRDQSSILGNSYTGFTAKTSDNAVYNTNAPGGTSGAIGAGYLLVDPIISNQGQTATDVNITLPAAAQGMKFKAAVGTTQAANYWRFTAATASTMHLSGSATGKNYVQFSAPTEGNSFSAYTFLFENVWHWMITPGPAGTLTTN